MSEHPAIQRCVCGHTAGDHQGNGGGSFCASPKRGICLVHGCSCREHTPAVAEPLPAGWVAF